MTRNDNSKKNMAPIQYGKWSIKRTTVYSHAKNEVVQAIDGDYHSNLFVGHPKLEGHGHPKLEGHIKESLCISGDHLLRSSCL